MPTNRRNVRSGRSDFVPGGGFEALEPRVLLSFSPMGPFPPDPGGANGSANASHIVEFEWRGFDVRAVENQWIASFTEMMGHELAETKALAVAAELGLSVESVRSIARGHNAVINISGQMPTPAAVDAVVAQHDWLLEFYPDFARRAPQNVPNDPRFSDQWHHQNIGQVVPPPSGPTGVVGADINSIAAWATTTGSEDVVVAVIDTGIDLNHPDLRDNIWVNPLEIADGTDTSGNGFIDDINGWDFGANGGIGNNNPQDLEGHGTGVAGMIGAVGNNGLGVTGVAWNVKLMAIKIADNDGSLLESAILGAHDYVTMMRGRGINIVASNNSYGAYGSDFFADFEDGIASERAAIERYINAGGIFIAAAGNDSIDNDSIFAAFPASYNIPGIISVAATNNQDQLASFSNFGAERVQVAAPGEDIFTTRASNLPGTALYEYTSGTSFAAPIVAGVVALIRSVRPDISADRVRELLIETSRPVENLTGRVTAGGVVNVAAALEALFVEGPEAIAISPGPLTTQLDRETGQAIDTITVRFSNDIDAGVLEDVISSSGFAGAVSLFRAGQDGQLGTGDDQPIGITSIELNPDDPRQVTIGLNLNPFTPRRLPVDQYRLTLLPAAFKDTAGNFLNGDEFGGDEKVYNFRVLGATSSFEPNDTLANATLVPFTVSGEAFIQGLVIGDGSSGTRDVDIFRLELERAGQIRAEVFAQRRLGGSNLDSYLRLFDANGNEIAANDQFEGSDSLINYFVTTNGTFYLAVSAFPNIDYNPNTAASGVQSQSTGVYDLSIGVDLVFEDRRTFTRDHSDDPLRIPQGDGVTQPPTGTTISTLTVDETRPILDLNVRVNIQHSFVSDMRLTLIAPDGTSVLLFDRRGGNGQDLAGTVFNDEAAVEIANGVAPFDRAGGYKPENSLNAFNGKSAAGNWVLRVDDVKAGDNGFLLDWGLEFTLENQVSGPFEPNDTLSNAADIQGPLRNSGGVTINARIGDGGFGVLDRDLYRFEALRGETLRAVLTSAGTLNSAMRLFNSNGEELFSVTSADSLNSRIDRFVFTESGTYFLAVSEAANLQYDPNAVTSGTPSVTIGDYTLAVTLARGVSDPARALAGDQLAIGANADGTFRFTQGGATTGLRYNGLDFLLPLGTQTTGNPIHFYGARADGGTFRNDGPAGETGIPVTLTDQSDAFNSRIIGDGVFRGLDFTRSIAFGHSDAFLAIDVTLRNNGTATVPAVSWMEAFNPLHGLGLTGGSANTLNDVLNDGSGFLPFASASVIAGGFNQGLSIALAAPANDSRAIATFFSPTEIMRDPSFLLNRPINDPTPGTSDIGAILGASGSNQAMGLAFDLGDVEAGQAVNMRYFVFLGDSLADVRAIYEDLNMGVGTGHLAVNRASPAVEPLQIDPDGRSIADTAPTFPYRLFYPEGFAGPATSTFIPISNPNTEPVRVVVIARYEAGFVTDAQGNPVRDVVLADQLLQPGARGGITVTTPEMFANDTILVEKNTPYAVEIRSELPVAATFSHYDEFFFAGGQSGGLGESFLSRVSNDWIFGDVTKGPGVRDFMLFQNPTAQPVKVTATALGEGGQRFELTLTLQPYARGGIDIRNASNFTNINTGQFNQQLPDGNYGFLIEAEGPVVASLSHYDANNRATSGVAGTPGRGSTTGIIPEGQIGLEGDSEKLGLTNPNSTAATVLLKFQFQSGTSYRTTVNIPAFGRQTIDVGSLPNFPADEPYGVSFESATPVAISLLTQARGDEFAAAYGAAAHTFWGFGEGFRPGQQQQNNNPVFEFLRLFNPTDQTATVEIALVYTDGTSDVFRRSIEGNRVREFNITDELVLPERGAGRLFFSITVKSSVPIVAYMSHFDSFFPGGFGTLGTPLGLPIPIPASE